MSCTARNFKTFVVVGYRESKQGSGPFSKSSKQNNAYVCAFWYKGKSANRTKK